MRRDFAACCLRSAPTYQPSGLPPDGASYPLTRCSVMVDDLSRGPCDSALQRKREPVWEHWRGVSGTWQNPSASRGTMALAFERADPRVLPSFPPMGCRIALARSHSVHVAACQNRFCDKPVPAEAAMSCSAGVRPSIPSRPIYLSRMVIGLKWTTTPVFVPASGPLVSPVQMKRSTRPPAPRTSSSSSWFTSV